MQLKSLAIATFVTLALVPVQGHAQDAATTTTTAVNPEGGVPVYPYDITDRPYTVLGPVKAEVRKGTIFSKEAGQGKIYRELWERAAKMGADAVIKAEYGNARVTMMSWGSIKATGIAVKFTDPATPAAPAS